jgi:hypothetical protein
VARSLTSFFKRGLRFIQTCLQCLCALPALWSVWRNSCFRASDPALRM